MTYFVPFDGSTLSEAALRRARELAAETGTEMTAFTVVPRGNAEWARDRDLLAEGTEYDADRVVETARERVAAIAPDASFDATLVGRHDTSGRVASAIRDRAHEADAEVVFLGSANAGHVATTIAEVGPMVAADDTYDVYIARQPDGA